MQASNGANPMRWDCEKQGCFNQKKRPKIEVFAECLPGKIAFSDIDATCEIGGKFLFLEWKDHTSIGIGQKIYFEQITKLGPVCVFVIEGDAESMVVRSLQEVWGGKWRPRVVVDLQGLKDRIRSWARWADTTRRVPTHV